MLKSGSKWVAVEGFECETIFGKDVTMLWWEMKADAAVDFRSVAAIGLHNDQLTVREADMQERECAKAFHNFDFPRSFTGFHDFDVLGADANGHL